jgi:hypothetical protein
MKNRKSKRVGGSNKQNRKAKEAAAAAKLGLSIADYRRKKARRNTIPHRNSVPNV